MKSVVRQNERSWGIDLISTINTIANKYDLKIKRAGGERTISSDNGNRMFPDVILYGDLTQNVILQGWELKMPDVPIEDQTFINDAQRKAIALGLNSCLIWNFTYAVLYVLNDNGEFSIRKVWNQTNFIKTRDDVEKYREKWIVLLKEIIIEINSFFECGELMGAALHNIISDNVIVSLIKRNKDTTAVSLKKYAFKDAKMEAYLEVWWNEFKSEYKYDENDKYKAYAKCLILNWANRILFAHVIKLHQNIAMMIDGVKHDMSPEEVNKVFEQITAKSDFFNIFKPLPFSTMIDRAAWFDLVDFSLFLKRNNIKGIAQEVLQQILEGSVDTSKRELNGQFTTPACLADILSRITVLDWTGTFLDCCCGTGTIVKSLILHKMRSLDAEQTVESIWASDKYQYPLQIANIAMTSIETMNLANRVFQHNALTLSVGEKITIVDPRNGTTFEVKIPQFDAIVSNLPFVPFECIFKDGNEDGEFIKLSNAYQILSHRSDLYCYIALHLASLLKSKGRLGIITSNSWLGTKAGNSFFNALKEFYNILQVHLSGKKRWFNNAEVVTTILILEKRDGQKVNESVKFFLWHKSLEELSKNKNEVNTLVNSALLEKEINPNVVTFRTYQYKEIDSLVKMNISYNALFYDARWILDVKQKLVPVKDVFQVFRGSRRGWDPLFFPDENEHNIENEFLKEVFTNAKNVTSLIAKPNRHAFCCDLSIEELIAKKKKGALQWIEKFKNQVNKVGKPLPIVLKKKGMHWYELKTNEMAEMFTMMNPDKRLFFAKCEVPAFINQRLIGLNHKKEYSDLDLNHALLNSILSLYYIEASGFGRGLGVLDINKDRIENCYMIDPKQIKARDREDILNAFAKIKQRDILPIDEELEDEDRLQFEYAVLKSIGIETYLSRIKGALLSMQYVRRSVKE